MIDPLELERLAVRVERLLHTQTHGWDPGDEMQFKRSLPHQGVQTMVFRPDQLPSPEYLRQAARSIRMQGASQSGPSVGDYRRWIQIALRMEGLVQDNDPHNPKRMMRDMLRGKPPGRYASVERVSQRYLGRIQPTLDNAE